MEGTKGRPPLAAVGLQPKSVESLFRATSTGRITLGELGPAVGGTVRETVPVAVSKAGLQSSRFDLRGVETRDSD